MGTKYGPGRPDPQRPCVKHVGDKYQRTSKPFSAVRIDKRYQKKAQA